MQASRKLIAVISGLFLAGAAAAQEVYRWVDEDGVVNFSDTAPASAESGAEVNTLTLQDTTPMNYDPEQDIYNVAAQAERMQALRAEMEKEREARLEQQQSAPQQPASTSSSAVNYGYPYGYPAYGRPPLRPGRPPARPPERPVPEPYDTSTLRPLRPPPSPRGG
jgi:hypothetical protein